MSARPDLVACWLYRLGRAGEVEILLIRRAPGRVYPGLWQCVTGKLEAGEQILDGALREVAEETGLRRSDLEGLMDTDIVNWFHAGDLDTLLCEAVFAARVRDGAVITLSDEHDDLRWLTPEEAKALVVWPAYERAIDFVGWMLANPGKAEAYRLP
ncbi:MAG: NUDIX domain-containing protein [Chloroflexi bacterium]|nr:NUDIX domain-containing protein [Chloroflexota bacterium]